MDSIAVEQTVKGRILIIDDDVSILNLLERSLSKAGFLVKTVKDGKKATKLLDRTHYDMVITDIFMPNMDGFEVIRNFAPREVVKIIAMSSGGAKMPQSDILEIALQLGAVFSLTKPLKKELFLNMVQSILAKGMNDEK
ncbi:MAG: response regulator [Magnetococcales bacterium]|nr:response regulator [Magnetococcales bacterium]